MNNLVRKIQSRARPLLIQSTRGIPR